MNIKNNRKEHPDLQLVPGRVGSKEEVPNSCDAVMAEGRGQECEYRPDIPPVEQQMGRSLRFEGAYTWREKLWVVPSETRIGTEELAEALGRPKSWVYARTEASAEHKIPHRKLDGSFLVFVVGDIREWIEAREEVYPAQGIGEVA